MFLFLLVFASCKILPTFYDVSKRRQFESGMPVDRNDICKFVEWADNQGQKLSVVHKNILGNLKLSNGSDIRKCYGVKECDPKCINPLEANQNCFKIGCVKYLSLFDNPDFFISNKEVKYKVSFDKFGRPVNSVNSTNLVPVKLQNSKNVPLVSRNMVAPSHIPNALPIKSINYTQAFPNQSKSSSPSTYYIVRNNNMSIPHPNSILETKKTVISTVFVPIFNQNTKVSTITVSRNLYLKPIVSGSMYTQPAQIPVVTVTETAIMEAEHAENVKKSVSDIDVVSKNIVIKNNKEPETSIGEITHNCKSSMSIDPCLTEQKLLKPFNNSHKCMDENCLLLGDIKKSLDIIMNEKKTITLKHDTNDTSNTLSNQVKTVELSTIEKALKENDEYYRTIHKHDFEILNLKRSLDAIKTKTKKSHSIITKTKKFHHIKTKKNNIHSKKTKDTPKTIIVSDINDKSKTILNCKQKENINSVVNITKANETHLKNNEAQNILTVNDSSKSDGTYNSLNNLKDCTSNKEDKTLSNIGGQTVNNTNIYITTIARPVYNVSSATQMPTTTITPEILNFIKYSEIVQNSLANGLLDQSQDNNNSSSGNQNTSNYYPPVKTIKRIINGKGNVYFKTKPSKIPGRTITVTNTAVLTVTKSKVDNQNNDIDNKLNNLKYLMKYETIENRKLINEMIKVMENKEDRKIEQMNIKYNKLLRKLEKMKSSSALSPDSKLNGAIQNPIYTIGSSTDKLSKPSSSFNYNELSSINAQSNVIQPIGEDISSNINRQNNSSSSYIFPESSLTNSSKSIAVNNPASSKIDPINSIRRVDNSENQGYIVPTSRSLYDDINNINIIGIHQGKDNNINVDSIPPQINLHMENRAFNNDENNPSKKVDCLESKSDKNKLAVKDQKSQNDKSKQIESLYEDTERIKSKPCKGKQDGINNSSPNSNIMNDSERLFNNENGFKNTVSQPIYDDKDMSKILSAISNKKVKIRFEDSSKSNFENSTTHNDKKDDINSPNFEVSGIRKQNTTDSDNSTTYNDNNNNIVVGKTISVDEMKSKNESLFSNLINILKMKSNLSMLVPDGIVTVKDDKKDIKSSSKDVEKTKIEHNHDAKEILPKVLTILVEEDSKRSIDTTNTIFNGKKLSNETIENPAETNKATNSGNELKLNNVKVEPAIEKSEDNSNNKRAKSGNTDTVEKIYTENLKARKIQQDSNNTNFNPILACKMNPKKCQHHSGSNINIISSTIPSKSVQSSNESSHQSQHESKVSTGLKRKNPDKQVNITRNSKRNNDEETEQKDESSDTPQFKNTFENIKPESITKSINSRSNNSLFSTNEKTVTQNLTVTVNKTIERKETITVNNVVPTVQVKTMVVTNTKSVTHVDTITISKSIPVTIFKTLSPMSTVSSLVIPNIIDQQGMMTPIKQEKNNQPRVQTRQMPEKHLFSDIQNLNNVNTSTETITFSKSKKGLLNNQIIDFIKQDEIRRSTDSSTSTRNVYILSPIRKNRRNEIKENNKSQNILFLNNPVNDPNDGIKKGSFKIIDENEKGRIIEIYDGHMNNRKDSNNKIPTRRKTIISAEMGFETISNGVSQLIRVEVPGEEFMKMLSKFN